MIRVPREAVAVSFSRSGGPGGQNVNKTSTKAEVRFCVADAAWLSPEARARVLSKLATRITKEGELVVASEKHRSQRDNLEECFVKLEALLADAVRREKPRKATKPGPGARRRRLDEKKAHGARKRERRGGGFD
jgi:ribosome-associated protein